MTVPYVAATVGHRPAIAEAAEAASITALAIPMTASTGELTGPGPRPPKPKPGGGGSSGYVWGAAGPDPTWQEQLGDFGDRVGEWFPSEETRLARQRAADEQRSREQEAQRSARIEQCRAEVEQRGGDRSEYRSCRMAGKWVRLVPLCTR